MSDAYEHIRSGGTGFYEQKRGLISVSGNEAVQFLDGMITNDMKTLEDGQQMLAAFPNAQGRLIAVVRVLRQGDRFLFETENTTREKVFQNLFRFTFAGDFFVEDLSDDYRYFELFGTKSEPGASSPGFFFSSNGQVGYFAPADDADAFVETLRGGGGSEIVDELYETLRIESGIPKFGIDMDETTIVPELGLEEMISYTKGCYIGQEIIARIHFRGHVAKRLAGLTSNEPLTLGMELTLDGKNAGKVASTTFSPKLGKHIALAFVRYDHLAPGTVLNVENTDVVVSKLPFM